MCLFIVHNGKRLKELGMSVTKLWSIVHVYVVIHDMVPIRGNGRGGGVASGLVARRTLGGWREVPASAGRLSYEAL